MKVLAGVNGTQPSLDAIQFAARMLDASQDNFVLYFSPPHIEIGHEVDMIPSIPSDVRDRLVQDVFDNSRKQLPAAFRDSLETVVGEKSPTAGLLKAATQTRAELIVVGADAKSRNFGPFLGGVARKVAQDAEVPVLVHRKTSWAPSAALNILLAHDGSSAATLAGQQLAQFNWPSGTKATVVQVLEWVDVRLAGDPTAPSLWRKDYERYVANAHNHVREQLAEIVPTLPTLFHDQQPLIESGSPVQALCAAAEKHRADIIAVGPHNQGLLRKAFGATTASLLHYAPCSVLVAHQAQAA